MKDLKERGPQAPGTDADPQPNASRWSVSAIVVLEDTGLPGDRRMARYRRYAPLQGERATEERAEGDRVFVRDGAQVSSAASRAAIDHGLALVDEDLRRDVSLYVARRLVVFLKRPGDQSRFNMHLAAQSVEQSRLFNVQQYILSHPAADLSIAALAEMAAMSVRNFARVFTREVGVTPAVYVDLTRIDVACFLLEGSRLSLDTVAARSGFGSTRAMRRAFVVHLGATPSEYREHLRSS
jgi:transcriptional regulator GlxA family with amidase domain